MSFLDFIHRYMLVLDRIRSTKEWLSPNYHNDNVFIFKNRDLKSPDIVQLDDKRFVEDTTVPFWGAWMWIGIASFCFFVGIVPCLRAFFQGILGIGETYPLNNSLFESLFFGFFFLGFSLLGLPPIILSFVYLFKRPQKRLMIFDRENGTVTLPPRFWGEHEVVPFAELKVKRIRNLGSIVNFHVLAAFRPSDGQAIEFGLVQDNWKDWGFYCWYMDKNRPLPPGEVFEPYRERDEERRAMSSQVGGLTQ